MDVTCLCAKSPDLDLNTDYIRRTLAAGVSVMQYEPEKLHEVPGLAGSIVTNFCSSKFIENLPEIKSLGCKTCHSACMSFVNRRENIFAFCPPDASHFQSQYQKDQLWPQYAEWGVKRYAIIRGAFDPSDFPFSPRPHMAGEPFYVGRLARAARSKWSPHIFPILKAVRDRGIDVRFLGMAWTDDLSQWLGEPPEWAECLPENSITSQEFLARCHCLICPNASDKENCPRVGLEAMAAGVPVIADNLGGWPEMIVHGSTGLLCGTTRDYVDNIAWMANEHELRIGIAECAHGDVSVLICPHVIGREWMELFESL